MNGELPPKANESLYRWLIYHTGLDPIYTEDLDMSKDNWQAIKNASWHNTSRQELQNALDWAIEQGWITRSAPDEYKLTEGGQNLWVEWFEPDWSESYEYHCDDSDYGKDYYNIEYCAMSQPTLFKLVISDLCFRQYQHVELNSLQFEYGISFEPLYWKRLTGVSVRFDCQVHVSDITGVRLAFPEDLAPMMKRLKDYSESNNWESREWHRKHE